MHLLQLQQQFTEKLKDLRLRHERDIAALHEHFDPLIAAASSLASRHKQNSRRRASNRQTNPTSYAGRGSWSPAAAAAAVRLRLCCVTGA